MGKFFNTDGYCDSEYHYMVDLSRRLNDVRRMVDDGKYFAINRARQYGKTTFLTALEEYLKDDYQVISMDFQGFSYADFESEKNFTAAFSRQFLIYGTEIPDDIEEELRYYSTGKKQEATLSMLFDLLSRLCKEAERNIVLIIDEVDSATNNQVFIDFLSQLRFYYLKRRKVASFHSVILAGVYDVRSIKGKIRTDGEHKENSPWNIAADFRVDMSFGEEDIAGMLEEYEKDSHTGMDVKEMSYLIYSYTSGYPYLVSRLCKLIDERVAGTKEFCDRTFAWTKAGFLEAVKLLLDEDNPLFDSLMNKLEQFPELKTLISRQLFQGKPIAYNAADQAVRNAKMFGFVKVRNSTVSIANRIFESRLYNRFLLNCPGQDSKIYREGSRQKNQFVADGHLNMRKVLEKFVETFEYLYGDKEETFLEEEGRRYFMLFLRPIINGTGNCYVEPETRNQERMDLVIDYLGEQSVCELKIWRGNAYHERGERQLLEYLDHFGLNKGYMLSFNFNKKKEVGVKDMRLGDKLLIEAVV